MKIGIIGLGRMGSAITYRLCAAKHDVLAFDANEYAMQDAVRMGADIAHSPADLAQQVSIIWLMVPAGAVVDAVIEDIARQLPEESIIIDGGNSNYADSVRRYNYLAERKIHFIDCGTSGGLHGRDHGFSLMIGGERPIYDKLIPLFKAIAAPSGYAYMGPAGAGHYVKMVHNGIEYALLQAYAEGFQVLKEGAYPDLNLQDVTRVWNNGSIIRSWIVDLAQQLFAEHGQDFDAISGVIGGGQTGTWTAEEAQRCNIPVPMLQEALAIRAQSQETGGNYATKLVALLRHQFGGHPYKKL